MHKPPIQTSTTSAGGIDLIKKNLSSKGQQSKWSINIQEIVKRTQKNLERGPSSQKAGSVGANTSGLEHNQIGLNVSQSNQYLQKGLNSSHAQGKSRDKSSLLINDLKKRLTYESQNQPTTVVGAKQGSNLVVRKAESLSGINNTFNSAKSMRPASESLQSKNLYLASQKSSGTLGTSLQDRIQIARLKKSHTYGQGN